jgi:hypothetical protein
VFRLDYVAVPGNNERALFVGHAQECFESAQAPIGTPVLGQLDRSAGEIAVLLQLAFEELEQRKCIGGTTGEPPAKPAITRPSARVLTLCAFPFITVLPMLTWPSPAIATLPSRRTETMVVPRNCSI